MLFPKGGRYRGIPLYTCTFFRTTWMDCVHVYLLVDRLPLPVSVPMTTPPSRQFGMETLNILVPVPSPTSQTVLLSTSSLASFRDRLHWSRQLCMQWLDVAVWMFLSALLVRTCFRLASDTMFSGGWEFCMQWLNVAVWMFLSALLVRTCFRIAIDPGNTMFGGARELGVQWFHIRIRLVRSTCTRNRSSFRGFNMLTWWWCKLFVEGLHIRIGGCGWGFSLFESSVVANNVRVVVGPTRTSFCTKVVSNLYIVAWSSVTRGAWLDGGWVLDLGRELWNEHKGAVRRWGLWGLKQCQDNYYTCIHVSTVHVFTHT